MTAPANYPTQRQMLFILWASLISSHLMYLVVLLLAPQKPRAEPALVLPLSAVAVVMGLAALALYFKSLGDEPLAAWAQQERRGGQDRAQAGQAVLARVFPMSLVCWALTESVSLMGMVLALLGQIPLQRFFLFLGGGIALMLVCRPRLAAVDRAVSSAYGGPHP